MMRSKGDLIILLLLGLFNFSELSFVFYIVLVSLLFLYYVSPFNKAWPFVKKITTIVTYPFFIFLYGKIKMVEPAVCALGILSFLKYSEMASTRDKLAFYTLVIIFISGSVLLSSDVIYLVISLGSLLYIFSELAKMSGASFSRTKLIKILIPSLVFSSFIFVIVPQVRVGNIFKYVSSDKAKTGFSDSIKPGDYKGLVSDDELYLFATYKKLPTNGYWRGITYNATDGRRWFQRRAKYKRTTALKATDPDVTVRILDKNSNQYFYLDGSEITGVNGNLGVLKGQFNDYKSLRLSSTNTYGLKVDGKKTQYKTSLDLSLNYPKKNVSQRMLDFVDGISEKSNDKKVRSLLEKFKSLGLTYSLDTEVDQGSDLSAFLFDYKKGYCVHFASSFALALRLIGVPANVIGGFYGGDVSTEDSYILVKGSNAHAWVEYWNGNSWVRLDPVASLVPAAELPRNDLDAGRSGEVGDIFGEISIFKYISQKIEIFYLRVNAKFFEFDINKQYELLLSYQERLSNLKFKDVRFSLFIFLLFVIVLGLGRLIYSRNNDKVFIQKLITKLELERFSGIERLGHELVARGLDKGLVNQFISLFSKKNYSCIEIDTKEYGSVKKKILKELRNH